jgi:APA family basic amino acid/polyamine antiporter
VSTTDSTPRVLGLTGATALVVGNMVGSGAFLLPASLAPFGAASLLGWGVSAAGAVLLAIVFARLAAAYPRTGGPYAYAHYAFGDHVGFTVAWCYWVAIWCANAAIAVAFAGSLGALWPALTETPLRSALCALDALWLCTFFNLRGLRTAGSVQTITTVLKVLPLFAVALIGIAFVDGANLQPFNPSGKPLLEVATATTALSLWALLGLECATVPAESVRDAERTVPRATVIGTLVATALTVLGCTVVLGLAPAGELQNSSAPFADVALHHWGRGAAYVMAATMAVSTFGALNGWIIMQGQIAFAAARDGLFPAVFARTDKRGTPAFGLVAGSVLASLLVVANFGGSLVQLFTWSILLSTAATLVPYLATAAAGIVHSRRLGWSNGAGVGLGVISLLALLYSLLALIGTGREALIWFGGLLLAGLLLRGGQWLWRVAMSA